MLFLRLVACQIESWLLVFVCANFPYFAGFGEGGEIKKAQALNGGGSLSLAGRGARRQALSISSSFLFPRIECEK